MYRPVLENLPGSQDRGREVAVIDRIGMKLSLQTEGVVLSMDTVPGRNSFKVVPGIELD